MTSDSGFAFPTPDEQAIMLEALAAYSDACKAPHLTPGCPFAHDISPGQRGCLAECEVILAAHGRPLRQARDHPLEAGLAAFRRRNHPLQRQTASGRPFDAGQVFHEDSDKDIAQRSAVSLVYGLKTLMVDGVDDSREYFGALGAELNRRGFDVDALIRESMQLDLMFSIVLRSVVGVAVGVEHDPRMIGWSALLDDLLPEGQTEDVGQQINALVHAFVLSPHRARLVAWIRSAPLDDLVSWAVPDRAAYEALPTTAWPTLNGVQVWLADRFATTYLTQWRGDSLELEHDYQNGRIDSPLPAAVMRDRPIDLNLLNSLVAERSRTNGEPALTAPATAQFMPVAISMLDQGRRSSAAAVFEAAVALRPDDPDAHNNLGFCLLPDDPADALKHLEQANDLRDPHDTAYPYSSLMTEANRLLALLRLGRLVSALDLAERIVATWSDAQEGGVLMWEIPLDPSAPATLYTQLKPYTLRLIEHIAAATDDTNVISKWKATIETLRASE